MNNRVVKFRAYKNGMVSKPFTLGEGVCWPDGSVSTANNLKEIMQFTGLHDKNGVEIYEGDICKITETDEGSLSGREFEYIGYVAWGTGKWRFKDKVSRSLGAHDWTRYSNLGDWDAVFEVIGNIYEHHELLEDK